MTTSSSAHFFDLKDDAEGALGGAFGLLGLGGSTDLGSDGGHWFDGHEALDCFYSHAYQDGCDGHDYQIWS